MRYANALLYNMQSINVVDVAKGLLDSPEHTDPEYIREVVEMTTRLLGLSHDDSEYVEQLIGLRPWNVG